MLEHLTLYGSESFPIQDVFTELQKRSYATFMNAATSGEWTMYPFSTTNERDFYYVRGVYLDCVFHPRLRREAFQTECHHLQFEGNGPANALKHGGVVYNEMLAQFTQPMRWII
jgi:Zn-dependent M16 (insulinase) family peptidase